jgi:hypothetical protein
MSTTETNPKCSTCKHYWIPDYSDIKSNGLHRKTCKRCLERNKELFNKNKCEHNKAKSICKDCGGIQICKHNKLKAQCKECGSSQICEHNRLRSRCKDCKGGSICIHNNTKSTCKDCGGSQVCEHNRIKAQCKQCGGSQICKHNKRKSECKECGGSQICVHNREKSRCKVCDLKLYLVNLQRTQIKRCIKNSSNIIKTKHSIEYLGCDAKYFIEYFTKKMDLFNSTNDTKMTWDNIHIDHIKPISAFILDNEEEFNDCCHFTNLQPLLAYDNLKKRCTWTEDNNTYWLENMKRKEHINIYIP